MQMNRTAALVTKATELLESGIPAVTAFIDAVHSVSGHSKADRALAMRIFAIHAAGSVQS